MKHFELQSPNRLVIDVSGSVYKVSKQAVKIDSDLIRKIRFGYGDTEQGKLVRCVFDLSRKTTYAVQPAEGGVLIRLQKGSAVAQATKRQLLPIRPRVSDLHQSQFRKLLDLLLWPAFPRRTGPIRC